MIYTFIFSYYPLSGWIMAFQNYKPAKGYLGSKFVGLDQFYFLFGDIEFWRSLRNTLAMSLMNLVFGFLFAIVFALLLNEIKSLGFKRVTQTISYLPHFLSWIIVCSLVSNMLSTNDGAVNNLLMGLGIINEPILWLGDQKYFWWITTLANIWKETGWNSIIYIAAITGIDQAMYEAAELDGANRFQKMWHITLPGIRPTIIVLLIMNLGWVLNASFEVPYILGGGLLQDVSQTLDIFVLKYGMSIGNYSLATAAGIFKSVISLILVFATNAVANKLGENSLM
ncbi:ABC transporter, permease protein [Clostridium sp. KLE 1755]|nr:ABC transporter, permease protein [Clostridium sp. KLE 1755]